MPDEFKNTSDLKQIPVGQSISFQGIFILLRKQVRTAKTGNKYLSIELGDKHGSFSTNCFGDSAPHAVLETVKEGEILKVSGESDHFNDRFSPKLRTIEVIDEETASTENLLADLVETPPEREEDLWESLQEAVASIQHEGLKATVQHVLDETESSFRTRAAAISMHHAYRHGLLEHTVHMVKACRALLPLYREVDPDLALAGIILHDVGKLEEYTGTGAARKTRTGILQGHVVLGFRVVRKAALTVKLNADLTERLEHIILSHQGELAWGAAVMAATPEAVFVSMIDNLDAKMGMVQRALRNTPGGEVFSEYLGGLQTSLLVEAPKKATPSE